MVRAIDEIPILSVVAARARGRTIVRDAEELRVKESDRAASTVAMLRAFGVDAVERPDGLEIQGDPDGRFRPGDVDSHGDHRIAMAAAVAAHLTGPVAQSGEHHRPVADRLVARNAGLAGERAGGLHNPITHVDGLAILARRSSIHAA